MAIEQYDIHTTLESYVKAAEGDTVKRKCIMYAKDGNKIIKPWKILYPLDEINKLLKGMYLEYKPKPDVWDDEYLLYEDFAQICLCIGKFNKNTNLEDLVKSVASSKNIGVEGYLRYLEEKEEKHLWINSLDIELCSVCGRQDLAEHYTKYHDNEKKAREERENQIEREKLEREAQAAEVFNKRMNELCNSATDTLLSHAVLNNQLLDESTGQTIILYLFKKYGIDVPSKTQGWINRALARVQYDEDEKIAVWNYKKYSSSKVIHEYLYQLIRKMIESREDESEGT